MQSEASGKAGRACVAGGMHLDGGGAFDDVIVGHDVALLVPYDAAASTCWVVLHICCEGIPPAENEATDPFPGCCGDYTLAGVHGHGSLGSRARQTCPVHFDLSRSSQVWHVNLALAFLQGHHNRVAMVAAGGGAGKF